MGSRLDGEQTVPASIPAKRPAHGNYYPQLDGLRAIAVIAVLISHWTSSNDFLKINIGAVGVNVFFVLSGFLITQILLNAREKSGTKTSNQVVLKAFYARRLLRIFPIYYAAILVGVLCDWQLMREDVWYHLLYLSNIRDTVRGSWSPGLGHLWSLSVEEQFYLVWPIMMLSVPRKYLRPMMLGAILLAIVFRVAMAYLGTPHSSMAEIILTPACLDCLAGGALLALLIHQRGKMIACPAWAIVTSVLASIAVIVAICWVPLAEGLWWIQPVFFRGASAVLGVAMVVACVNGIKGPAGKLLEFGPLRYLGRISYGVYVIHTPMPTLSHTILKFFDVSHHVSGALLSLTVLSLALLLTITIASLSWYLMEAPLNGLKRYFPYVPNSGPGRTAN
ncbi:MAG: acyltransferase [Planctomycetota bacterium]